MPTSATDDTPKTTTRPPTIEGAGRVLGLAAILVPAIGAGSRYIAIALVPDPAPAASLATSTPLPELAFFGTLALVLVSAFLYPFLVVRSLAPLLAIRLKLEALQEQLERMTDAVDELPPDVREWTAADVEEGSPAVKDAPPEIVAAVRDLFERESELDRDLPELLEAIEGKQPAWIPRRRWMQLAVLAVLGAGAAGTIVVVMPVPFVVVGGAAVLGQFAYYSRLVRQRGELPWAHAWPGAIAVAVAAILLVGFASFGTGATAGRYHLDGRIPDGMYAHLGSAHGLTYLRACDHADGNDAPVLAVPPDAIERVESIQLDRESMAPTLWGIIVRGEPFSIANRLRCVEAANGS